MNAGLWQWRNTCCNDDDDSAELVVGGSSAAGPPSAWIHVADDDGLWLRLRRVWRSGAASKISHSAAAPAAVPARVHRDQRHRRQQVLRGRGDAAAGRCLRCDYGKLTTLVDDASCAQIAINWNHKNVVVVSAPSVVGREWIDRERKKRFISQCKNIVTLFCDPAVSSASFTFSHQTTTRLARLSKRPRLNTSIVNFDIAFILYISFIGIEWCVCHKVTAKDENHLTIKLVFLC